MSPKDREAGRQLFRSTCAACHGLDGGGGSNGPSLNRGSFKHGGSDEALFRTITKGVPDTPMTAHPLDGRDVWRLVAFIRYLGIGKGAELAKGDPARGARVFAAGGCARCHTAHGEGGLLGPDLSSIGSQRPLAHLETSIVDPDASVSPEYWTLRARTRAGQTVTGIRMNEDMDSFQIREASGRLRSLWKADLASYQIVHTSPMPSYKDKLQPGELEDLVAYLAGMRAREGQ